MCTAAVYVKAQKSKYNGKIVEKKTVKSNTKHPSRVMRRKRSQGPHPKSNTFTVSFTIVVIFVLFLIHIQLITVICICVSAKKER